MPSLAELLPAAIQGARASQQDIASRNAEGLQQAQGVMSLAGLLQQQQQVARVREALQQSGGDVSKAMQAALAAGDATTASHLAPVMKAQAEAKALQGLDMTNPDAVEKAGLVHPSLLPVAERLRKNQAATATAATMRSQPAGPAPDQQEVEQAADQGTAAPAQQAGAPGLFATLMDSKVPGIASYAKQAQAQLDASDPRVVPPQHWQDIATNLSRQETAYLNRRPVSDPLKAVIGPDGKPTYVPESKAAGMTPALGGTFVNVNSGAAGGKLDPEDAKFMAQQYLAGDKSVLTGLGRGVQGSQNVLAMRSAIRQEAQAAGMTPVHVAIKLAEFEGLKAGERTAGTREAQLGFAAHELEQFVPLAAAASARVPRSDFVPLNRLIQMGEKQWSPEQSAFVAANRAVINAFAQVASRGVATVHSTQQAEEMLSTAATHDQYAATLKQLDFEVKGALKAPGQVREDLANRTGAPAAPVAPTQAPMSLDAYLKSKGH